MHGWHRRRRPTGEPADEDDLYVVVVGGVPVGLMTVQAGYADNGDCYLSDLCSVRGSGSGALLVAHAQRVVVPPGAALTVDALAGALQFYAGCGFVAAAGRAPTALVWRRHDHAETAPPTGQLQV